MSDDLLKLGTRDGIYLLLHIYVTEVAIMSIEDFGLPTWLWLSDPESCCFSVWGC